jgi:transposase
MARLRRSGEQSPRQARIEDDVEWIHRVLRRGIPLDALRKEFDDLADLPELLDRLYGSRLTFRNRAMAVLAHLRGISDHVIAAALKITHQTVRRCRRRFQTKGAAGLFARKRKSGLKIDDEDLKTAIFRLLHEPPSNHGINRTSWTMAHLCDMLAKQGKPACPNVVAAITKAAGYKWRKARRPHIERPRLR